MTRDPYASLKQGLVGCWIPSISGSGLLLPDLSGRGNNGSLTNMDASDWVSGQYGRALDFDGSNDWVDFGSTSLVPSGSFSIVWWEQISTVGANVFFPQVTLRLSASASFLIYRSNYNVAGQDYRFLSFGQATSTLTNVLKASNASDPGTVTGVWNCFCITGTSITSLTAANFAVYENGRSLTIATAGQYQAATYVNNFASDGLGTFSLTKLDDIRVYNRDLTEPEIKLLASRPGIGLRQESHRQTFYQFPSGARRKRILTGMP